MAKDANDTATIHMFKAKGRPGPRKTRIGSDKENNAMDQGSAREKRKGEGKKRVSIWLDSEAQGIVEKYKTENNVSQEKAINELIELYKKPKPTLRKPYNHRPLE